MVFVVCKHVIQLAEVSFYSKCPLPAKMDDVYTHALPLHAGSQSLAGAGIGSINSQGMLQLVMHGTHRNFTGQYNI